MIKRKKKKKKREIKRNIFITGVPSVLDLFVRMAEHFCPKGIEISLPTCTDNEITSEKPMETTD